MGWELGWGGCSSHQNEDQTIPFGVQGRWWQEEGVEMGEKGELWECKPGSCGWARLASRGKKRKLQTESLERGEE